MNARNLAKMIESYLEDDGGSDDGSSGTSISVGNGNSGTSQQIQQLMQTTAQLQQNMASIQNSLQISTLLPLLMNQSVTVASDTFGSTTSPNAFVPVGSTFEFKQTDTLTTLLPLLLMGGLGGSTSGGTDNSNNMLLLLALAGLL